MKRTHLAGWLVAAAALGMSSAAAAEEASVKNPNTPLLSKKSAGSQRLAQLPSGTTLEVIGREGSWLKVRVEGKEGYVHENSVGGGKGGGGISAAARGLSGTADPKSSSAAGRGGFASDEWARSTGKSLTGLERMLELRKGAEADYDKFTSEGNVGPAKK